MVQIGKTAQNDPIYDKSVTSSISHSYVSLAFDLKKKPHIR